MPESYLTFRAAVNRPPGRIPGSAGAHPTEGGPAEDRAGSDSAVGGDSVGDGAGSDTGNAVGGDSVGDRAESDTGIAVEGDPARRTECGAEGSSAVECAGTAAAEPADHAAPGSAAGSSGNTPAGPPEGIAPDHAGRTPGDRAVVTSVAAAGPGSDDTSGGRKPAGVWRRVAARWPSGRLRLAWHPLGDLPFDYPPKVVLFADLALLVLGLIACLQRHAYFPTVLPLLAVVLLFLSVPAYVLFGIVPRPLALCLATMAAAALFFAQPVESDFAPFVLMVVAAEIAAIAPKRVSIPLALLATVELIVFAAVSQALWGNDYLRTGVPMYALGILLGWLVGVMLQYQRLYLYQERENQNVRAAQAAAAERNRIAREVHDVIAHSLTVTLLHVTAARHALTTDSDVDEAVDALADAERLGRQAMADIRRTVGLLDSSPASAGPEPGADDIPVLVDDFVNAGLTVRRWFTGDLGRVSAAVGLALYRICQESLANIAKHAPGAAVEFAVEVGARSAVVRVRNPLPAGVAAPNGHGTGVAGMRQRAEGLGGRIQLGPDAGWWVVRAEFPLHDRPEPVADVSGEDREEHCPLVKSFGVPPLRRQAMPEPPPAS